MATARPITEWLASGSVPAACAALDDLLGSELKFILITAIDSNRAVERVLSDRVTRTLSDAPVDRESVSPGVLVQASGVRALLDDRNYFTGFDELWFFGRPPACRKPPDVHLTSELPIHRLDVPRIFRWMAASNCELGLGDGDGLNVATQSAEIAALIAESAGLPARAVTRMRRPWQESR